MGNHLPFPTTFRGPFRIDSCIVRLYVAKKPGILVLGDANYKTLAVLDTDDLAGDLDGIRRTQQAEGGHMEGHVVTYFWTYTIADAETRAAIATALKLHIKPLLDIVFIPASDVAA